MGTIIKLIPTHGKKIIVQTISTPNPGDCNQKDKSTVTARHYNNMYDVTGYIQRMIHYDKNLQIIDYTGEYKTGNSQVGTSG